MVTCGQISTYNSPFILAVCLSLFFIIGSYCECFAAGVYCVDSCACVNCYNKPEFEDTVLDIRQQIEARNPLAFTPKVVDNAIDSSPNFTVIPVKVYILFF